jgi:hypothetical protein
MAGLSSLLNHIADSDHFLKAIPVTILSALKNSPATA